MDTQTSTEDAVLNTVPSLWDLSLMYCAQNPNLYSTKTDFADLRVINPDIYFTQVMVEAIIDFRQQSFLPLDDEFMSIFSVDACATPIKSLNLKSATICERVLYELIIIHNLTDLDLSYCDCIETIESFEVITKYAKGLRSLLLPNNVGHLLAAWFSDAIDRGGADALLDLPNLKAFSADHVQYLETPSDVKEDYLLHALIDSFSSSLVWLQLTNSVIHRPLTSLTPLKKLTALLLADVDFDCVREKFEAISSLKQLRVLDISMSGDNSFHYNNPNKHLHDLVTNLPLLKHLDISGTNLAGERGIFVVIGDTYKEMDIENGDTESVDNTYLSIPGIPYNRRFDFLGLQKCPYNPCRRKNLPADRVTGDDDEEQTILSLEVYLERPNLLVNALNHMFYIMRYSLCKQMGRALNGILASMKKHPGNKHVQISGSASIFYIVKAVIMKTFTNEMKRKITSTLVSGIKYHLDETNMIRNSCLILTYFNIPKDVMTCYDDLASVLLQICQPDHNSDDLVNRIVIFLINGLTGKVTHEKKVMLGDLNLVESMVRVINRKIDHQQPDEVMDSAWGAMWNITDETPENSEKFLQIGGLKIMYKCYKYFNFKKDIMFSMMGLIGNIAEQYNLHKFLMEEEFILAFMELMEDMEPSIQLSYNCCGTFAHLLCNKDNWHGMEELKDNVRRSMVYTINSWNIDSLMIINYRSLTPMVQLLHADHSPESQLWASWAIKSICKSTPALYIPLLLEIDGDKVFRGLLENSETPDEVQDMSRDILAQCTEFHQERDKK